MIDDQTLDLSALVNQTKQNIIKSMSIHSVGVVTSYESGLASVKPLIIPKNDKGDPVPQSLIHKVVLLFPGGDGCGLVFPVDDKNPEGTPVVVFHIDLCINDLVLSKKLKQVITDEKQQNLRSHTMGFPFYGFFNFMAGDAAPSKKVSLRTKPENGLEIPSGNHELIDMIHRLMIVVSKIMVTQGQGPDLEEMNKLISGMNSFLGV